MAEIVLAKHVQSEFEKNPYTGARVHVGFDKFDEATKGFRPGQLVVISGPTGSGKTAICRTFTQKMIDSSIPVCWFSYEENYEELFEKMTTLEFYVPDKLEDDQVEWVKTHMLKAKEKGITTFFIDNLDFLRKPKDLKMPDLNLASYVGAIVQEIKHFAVTHQLLVFLLVHLKKNNWTSKEMPTSEDIRDSGMVPQLADFVLFMKRERNDANIQTNFARLSIDKNRVNGKCLVIDLVYDDQKLLYRETTADDLLDVAQKPQEMPSWDDSPSLFKKRGKT